MCLWLYVKKSLSGIARMARPSATLKEEVSATPRTDGPSLLSPMNLKQLIPLALIQSAASSSITAGLEPAGIRMFTYAHRFHVFVYRQVAGVVFKG